MKIEKTNVRADRDELLDIIEDAVMEDAEIWSGSFFTNISFTDTDGIKTWVCVGGNADIDAREDDGYFDGTGNTEVYHASVYLDEFSFYAEKEDGEETDTDVTRMLDRIRESDIARRLENRLK